jgi:lysylphosphatidylglycerol synthetase-like protein (DUF2156 family)
MKQALGLILAIAAGCFIGFFGVLVSVFADGGLQERLITIGFILLIYAFLGCAWSLALPGKFWRWVLALSLPGMVFLLVYLQKEFNPLYLVYMILILGCTVLGAFLGQRIRKRRSRAS